MKKNINIYDYSNQIMNSLKKGVLLTTKGGEVVNSMTISWGALAIEWAKPMFIVFVRENRFTKKLLEENPEFTINIALDDLSKSILGFCGTKSGKNVNKIEELNLTLEDGEKVNVPAIKELPLTLECKVVYKQRQDENEITDYNKTRFYPQDVGSDFHGANEDYHTMYFGEIVASYIVE